MSLLKKFLVVTLWLFLLGISVPSCGKKIDKMCVKGKARIHQKVATWGFPGEEVIEPGDRIIRRECSEFMRKITFRNNYDTLRDNGYIPDWL